MEVYLIRHTTPDIAKGTCYGQLDINLNTRLYNEELKSITSKLPYRLNKVYTSPLKRCSFLANDLAENVIESNLLKEIDFGNWEGLKWENIPPKDLKIWGDDFVNSRVPKGENYKELHQRTLTFIGQIINTEYEKIGIVTHAGNIRSFISHVLGLPLENSFRIYLNYGSVVHIELNHDLAMCKLIAMG